jgi:hypothetical protein
VRPIGSTCGTLRLALTVSPDAFSHSANACRACFADGKPAWHELTHEEFSDHKRSWRLRPNPAYWGAPEPEILVLGFSKGGDQREMIDSHVRGRKKFEDIPFNSITSSMRRDLVDLLVTMGLCSPRQVPDALFLRENVRFGFASLIRCSVSMRPPGKNDYVYSGSGILERTVRSGQKFVVACVERHLLPLPSSVRLVVMLSSSEDYIDACRGLFDGEWFDPDAGHKYAYRVKGILFVHVPHPSGQAAGFRAVFNGKRGPTGKEKGIPECRRQALAVVVAAGLSPIP